MSRPDLRWAGVLAENSGILPTAAILVAEEHAAAGGGLWCCPLCGGLNVADDPAQPFAGAGWCQHEPCADRRDLARAWLGVPVAPEILFPAAAFDRRALVLAG